MTSELEALGVLDLSAEFRAALLHYFMLPLLTKEGIKRAAEEIAQMAWESNYSNRGEFKSLGAYIDGPAFMTSALEKALDDLAIPIFYSWGSPQRLFRL